MKIPVNKMTATLNARVEVVQAVLLVFNFPVLLLRLCLQLVPIHVHGDLLIEVNRFLPEENVDLSGVRLHFLELCRDRLFFLLGRFALLLVLIREDLPRVLQLLGLY